MMKKFLLLAILPVLFAACSPKPKSLRQPFDPCGELQDHLLEIQHIEEELAVSDNLDEQARLRERKHFLQREDERLNKKCGRN